MLFLGEGQRCVGLDEFFGKGVSYEGYFNLLRISFCKGFDLEMVQVNGLKYGL